MLWHDDHELPAGVDLVVLPGGFSHGDYLRCGAIAGRAAIMDAVRAHAARGGLVLGVCNGFQILRESGLLPGVLMRNANLRFVCKMQHLRVERNDTAFTSHYAKGQISKSPSPTARAITRTTTRGSRGWRGGLVAFRYCDALGNVGGAAIPTVRVTTSPGFILRGECAGADAASRNLIDPRSAASTGARCSRVSRRRLRRARLRPTPTAPARKSPARLLCLAAQ